MQSSPSAEIDPVEALMVTVGLKAIISRTVEKFRQGDLRRAVMLGKEIQRLARDLVNGELKAAGTSEFNYRPLLKDLARGWDQEQVIEMMAQFPPEFGVHTTGLLIRSKQIIDALLTDYPQTNYVTATGSINLVPSDLKIFKFAQVLEVLVDPLEVFGLMAEGGLLQTQVAIVRRAYPSISDAIDAALLDETVKAKARDKAFELPGLTEIGVRAWYGKGPISTSSLKLAQSAIDTANQRKQDQAAAPTSGNLPRAQQTTAQAVESSR